MRSHKIASFLNKILNVCIKETPNDQHYPVDKKDKDSIFSWTQKELEISRYQMRINHTGEICAQALYAGHVHKAQDSDLNDWLKQAQTDEYAHLQWCQERLRELGSCPSRCDPLFYAGSYFLARGISCLSESYNIRFIRETERQVQEHLERQLSLLKHDPYSSQIIQQMIVEEKEHHDQAQVREPRPMPSVVSWMMQCSALCMKIIVKYV